MAVPLVALITTVSYAPHGKFHGTRAEIVQGGAAAAPAGDKRVLTKYNVQPAGFDTRYSTRETCRSPEKQSDEPLQYMLIHFYPTTHCADCTRQEMPIEGSRSSRPRRSNTLPPDTHAGRPAVLRALFLRHAHEPNGLCFTCAAKPSGAASGGSTCWLTFLKYKIRHLLLK